MTRSDSVIARAALWGALAVLAVPTLASAQAPSPAAGISRSGPNGLKVGEGRLHPFVDLEPRVDTAAGFFPVGGGSPPSYALSTEVVAHVRPGVKFELPGSGVSLDFTGEVDYLYYTGLLTPGSYIASRLEGAAMLAATFNRGGPLQLTLSDDFSYSDKTRNLALGVGALSLFNDVKGQLDIRPGGGALEISPRGGFIVEQFRPISGLLPSGCASGQPCDPATVPRMSYGNVRAGLDARWKFLPKTAVVLESSFDSRVYSDATLNPPTLLLRVLGGVQGLVTTKVAVVAKAGWGHDFAPPVSPTAPSASTFMTHLEASYLLNEASNLKAGYLRSLEPVSIYQTYTDDRAYAEARMLLGGRLFLRAYGALDFLGFGVGSGRQDIAVTVDPGVEYQITPWLYAASGYTLTVRASGGTGRSGASTDNFTRHEAYVRLTAAY